MVKSHIIEYYRNDRPEELIFGLVTSILLHCILFLGSKYWLRAFAPDQKLAQPIPIEYVEVPPNQTKTPPKTSRRATKDSVAGGEANPKRSVSVAKSGSPSAPKASASKSAEAVSQQLKQPAAVLPNISPQKPQPRSQKIVVVPDTTPPEPKLPQKVVVPDTTPPEPKLPQKVVVPDTTPLVTKLRKIAVLPNTTPLVTKLRKIAVAPEPKPLPTAVTSTTTPLVTKQQKIAVAPTTTPPVPKIPKTAVTHTTRSPMPLTHHENQNRVATKSTSSSSGTRTISGTSSQVQPSRKSGAASQLGGPLSLSMRDYRANSLADTPNSNRFNQSAVGIDARQDVNMGAYLEQLRQRVSKQWAHESTRTSWRTVLHFTLDREGQVNNLQIVQTSGSNEIDQAALRAVKRAAPFGPLPIYPYFGVTFTFNINIYGQLDIGDGGY